MRSWVMEDLDSLYRHRFPDKDRELKQRVWRVLCEHYFQSFVRKDACMLDLGCGFGEFSRYIEAARKLAVDINPGVARGLPPEVQFHPGDASDLSFLEDASVDVAFASNFFEHLPSKTTMDSVLKEVLRVLRPGGRLVVLQPNIRLAPGEYWDYYDHLLPLSDRSCAEAFAKAGFVVERVIPRFLPLTTRSRLPQHPLLVRLYLRVKPAWWVLGKQLLIVGQKPA